MISLIAATSELKEYGLLGVVLGAFFLAGRWYAANTQKVIDRKDKKLDEKDAEIKDLNNKRFEAAQVAVEAMNTNSTKIDQLTNLVRELVEGREGASHGTD